MRSVLRSKIHKATVTEAKVDYVGSIGIDKTLLEKVDIWPGEKVLVGSIDSGARLETYVIEGKPGEISLNGAAARVIKAGEEVIIMAFEITDKPIEPKIILVYKENRFLKYC